MRKLLVLALFASAAHAQQGDPRRMPIVLKAPGTEAVVVRKDIAYDGALKLDLYRPPNTTAALPVVVFINGVGAPDLKDWTVYVSWARLIAARGFAAITHQTESANALQQTESLLRYLRSHAQNLGIDPKRIALWSCSANVRVGTALVASHPADEFRASVFYYGVMSTLPTHPELPLYIARAGLDALSLNDTIDRYVAEAVKIDAPVTLVTYPEGRHAFDVFDDTDESRRIIRDTVDFLQYHLTRADAPKGPRPMSPSQLERLIRDKGAKDAIALLGTLKPDAVVLQEGTLNGVGYALLQGDRVADAVAIFEWLVAQHPQSSNAHDSLADAYERAGNAPRTLEETERALALVEKETLPDQRKELIRQSAKDRLARLKK